MSVASEKWLAMSEAERQAIRDELDKDGFVLEDHQAALRQTAAIMRRAAEREAGAA